jgi:hypothetical protein
LIQLGQALELNQMVTRGAPVGNRNAAKAKVWAAAIERALERRQPADERIKAIDELADKLLDQCAAGDLAALKELGDRLDGKPAQAITGESGGPLELVVNILRFSEAR